MYIELRSRGSPIQFISFVIRHPQTCAQQNEQAEDKTNPKAKMYGTDFFFVIHEKPWLKSIRIKNNNFIVWTSILSIRRSFTSFCQLSNGLASLVMSTSLQLFCVCPVSFCGTMLSTNVDHVYDFWSEQRARELQERYWFQRLTPSIRKWNVTSFFSHVIGTSKFVAWAKRNLEQWLCQWKEHTFIMNIIVISSSLDSVTFRMCAKALKLVQRKEKTKQLKCSSHRNDLCCYENLITITDL